VRVYNVVKYLSARGPTIWSLVESHAGGGTEGRSPVLMTWTVVHFVKSCQKEPKNQNQNPKSYPAVLQRSLYSSDVADHMERCTAGWHASFLETGASAYDPAVRHLIPVPWGETEFFP